MPDSLLTAITRYRKVRPLGEGGQGSVWLGEKTSSGGLRHKVALKTLRPEHLANPDAVRRLRDEASILGRLAHPGVVRVLDLADVDGELVLVLEYVEGRSLQDLFGRAPAPPRVAVGVASRVAVALEYLHAAQDPDTRAPLRLLHRDVKPQNVLVTARGEVKLVDFGLAYAEFDERAAKTRAGPGGTPGFIAPERMVGIDCAKGDVYSLAVTLVWMLAEDVEPLPGGASELDAWGRRVVPALPGPVQSVVRRALAADHEVRLRVDAFARELEAIERELTGDAVEVWARAAIRPSEPPPRRAPVDDPGTAPPEEWREDSASAAAGLRPTIRPPSVVSEPSGNAGATARPPAPPTRPGEGRRGAPALLLAGLGGAAAVAAVSVGIAAVVGLLGLGWWLNQVAVAEAPEVATIPATDPPSGSATATVAAEPTPVATETTVTSPVPASEIVKSPGTGSASEPAEGTDRSTAAPAPPAAPPTTTAAPKTRPSAATSAPATTPPPATTSAASATSTPTTAPTTAATGGGTTVHVDWTGGAGESVSLGCGAGQPTVFLPGEVPGGVRCSVTFKTNDGRYLGSVNTPPAGGSLTCEPKNPPCHF